MSYFNNSQTKKCRGSDFEEMDFTKPVVWNNTIRTDTTEMDGLINQINYLNLHSVDSNTININETNDMLDQIVDDFQSINIYNSYDEYQILVKSVNSNYIDYNKKQTICRYKRYIKHIKLPSELYMFIMNYLKHPKYELMKEIDNHILNLL